MKPQQVYYAKVRDLLMSVNAWEPGVYDREIGYFYRAGATITECAKGIGKKFDNTEKMEKIQQQNYVWKSKTNGNDLAKFRMRFIYDTATKNNAVSISKLILTTDEKPKEAVGFILLRKFKDKYLYLEHISLKCETLFSIWGTIQSELQSIQKKLQFGKLVN